MIYVYNEFITALVSLVIFVPYHYTGGKLEASFIYPILGLFGHLKYVSMCCKKISQITKSLICWFFFGLENRKRRKGLELFVVCTLWFVLCGLYFVVCVCVCYVVCICVYCLFICFLCDCNVFETPNATLCYTVSKVFVQVCICVFVLCL